MSVKDIDVVEVFIKAFKQSKGKTIDLVVEHELPGITPEQVNWFFAHADEYYKLWHPGDHIGWYWIEPPKSREQLGGALKVSVEKFGDTPACWLLMSREDPQKTPFDRSFGCFMWSNFFSPDRTIAYGCATHIYKAAPYGTWMRSIFRWPAKTPKWLLDAVKKHNREEMGELPKIVPDLYKKRTG
jgi:hypothetical protein